MDTHKFKLGALLAGLVSSTAFYIPLTAYSSGAGSISDQPLFTSISVKPNVLFMVDDSGSMDFELSTPDPTPSFETAAGGEEITEGGRSWVFFHLFDTPDSLNFNRNPINDTPYEDIDNDNRVAPSYEAAKQLGLTDAGDPYEGIWRTRNSDYNRQYYDPKVTYKPWAGKNEANQDYTNANVTAALFDPYDANSSNIEGSTTYNLTQNDSFRTRNIASQNNNWNVTIYPMTYWTWNDNGDGVVDPNEAGTHVAILPSGNSVTLHGITLNGSDSYTKAPSRTDCAGSTCTYAEESQNFANWWQYHRRREYSMKAAMADIINNAAGTRMGIATINSNDSANSELPIADIDTGNNKDNLMDSLFNIQSFGGTPLNRALRDAGRYYEGTGGPFSNNSSPIQSSVGMCQQNFTILLTDGAYDDDGAFSTPDNADGNNNTVFDGGPYADNERNTLADIAMYFYERDLSGLDNDVPTRCGVDQNDAQHMVTYTVSFGLEAKFPEPSTHIGLAHPVLDVPGQNCTATTVANPGWPSRSGGDFSTQNRVNELVHAAYNGRGEYYEAEDAEALGIALQQTLSSIADRTIGTGSGASFNASTLGTDSRLYLAQFDTSRWSGDLTAVDIIDQDDINNGSTQALGSIGSEIWSAANVLDTSAWANRHIWTHNGSVAGSGGRIPFVWGSLSAEQQNDLRTNSNGESTDDVATGQARLNYIHGDRSNESQNGGTFRQRDSRLGDIIQSGAVFVGIPSLNWPNFAPFPEADTAESYSEFRERLSNVVREPPTTGPVIDVTSARTEMVYVGANDGMLHAFRASDGAEQLAYIPSYLYSTTPNEGLHYLTDPTYTHRFSHDLTPTVSDIFTNNSWKTVLIGGHRAGARGFFALDVTDPSSFNTSNPVMWEFRGEAGPNANHPLGDPDLGFTFSKPTIVLTNEKDGAGNNRWAAVFGNGYKETGDSTGDGDAKLFIVFLDPNLSDGWTEGSDYIKISTGSNGVLDDNSGTDITPNGLSTPALVDLNGDGTVDRAYAGDLAGDMWAFDLCDRDSNGNCRGAGNWDVAHKSGALRYPLMNGDATKPITTQPQVIRNRTVHNTDANQPNLLVLFGTGRYISNGDNTNMDSQTFYGIWDAGSNAGNISANSSALIEQTFDLNTTNRVVTDNDVRYTETGTQVLGWHVDLPLAGERSVTNAVVRDNIVFFTTITPSANPCDGGGRSFIMFLAVENGGRPDESVFDFNNDGMVDSQDLLALGVGSGKELDVGIAASPSFLGNTLYVAGTETQAAADINTTPVAPLDPTGAGRLSWGELQQEYTTPPTSQ